MSFSASVENLVADSSDPLVGKADLWERVPLDDVFGILNGFPFKSVLFNKNKGFPIIRIRDITSGEISTYYDGPAEEDYWIEKGDLIVGMDGDFNSRKWRADRALLNQRCCKIYPKSTLYDYDFLSFVLPGYLKLINEETHSITVKHLSSKTISEIPLPLPPLNEQRRIVAKLEAVLAKVQSAQAHLDKIPGILKRTRQAILSAAVSGKLTADWREEQSLPLDWKKIKFEDLIQAGPQNGIYKPQSFYGEGVPIVRIDNFYEGVIQPWNTLKKLYLDDNELTNYKLENNDILINRVNSIEYLGKCGLVKNLNVNCVFESNIMRLSINNLALPEYVTLFLCSEHGTRELRKNAKHAVNQASINQTDVKSVLIPLCYLEEQQEIVRRVEALFERLDRIEAATQAAKVKVDAMTQSTLAKAFRGELVPQDPNDEPASVLLERINAEKAQTLTKPKAAKSKNAAKSKPQKNEPAGIA